MLEKRVPICFCAVAFGFMLGLFTPAALATEETVPVNAAGTYLFVDTGPNDINIQPDRPIPPTIISLSSLNFYSSTPLTQQYVGLYATGTFLYSIYPPSNIPAQNPPLGAVFEGANSGFIAPGNQAYLTPFVSENTWPNGKPTDITQDFTVPSVPAESLNAGMVSAIAAAQIPKGAIQLAFTVNDDYFSDNLSERLNVTALTLKDVFMGCADGGCVQTKLLDDGTRMQLMFTPNYNLTLAQAAALGGFTSLNWVQTVTSDPTKSLFVQTGDAPWNDPPGTAMGTLYCVADPSACETTADQIIMQDQPENGCFSSDLPCSGVRDPTNDPKDGTKFSTDLVGVLANGREVPLFEINWASNYSGVSGEAAQYGGDSVDSGSGSGGIDILSETYLDPRYSVPEPSTWVILTIGFAGLGLVGLPRRKHPGNPFKRDSGSEISA